MTETTARPWYINRFNYVETGAPPTGRQVRATSSERPDLVTINAANCEVARIIASGSLFSVPDAELIVKAVNAHDALVEACEAALRLSRVRAATTQQVIDMETKIHDALALAKGEK